MTEIDELRESIDARIVEAQNEIAALEAARAALRDGSAGPGAAATLGGSAKVARPARRGRPPKPATNGAGAEPPTPAAADTQSPTPAGDGAEPPVPAGDSAVPDARAETVTPRRAGTPSRRRARRKSASSQRRVEVLLAGKLEAMLAESEPGLSAATVAKRANASYRQVLVLLRELEQTGRIRRSGSSRASLWRVITDEERIAERAAELARLSTGSRSGTT